MSHAIDCRTLKSYRELAQGASWSQQRWGDSSCYAWTGTDEQVRLAYNLICNYDGRPNNDWGSSQRVPQLNRASETSSYIYASEERILDTLRFYFDIQLRYNHETGTPNPVPQPVDSDDENEVTPPWTSHLDDEDECARLALLMAQTFMAEEIRTQSFVPEAQKPLTGEFSTGRENQHDPHAIFESLVDRAASS